ncbi:MAG: NAD(+)/NADH kinase [Lachnospiraceae bacterium]|nr:NAD(+)/NADH kinase [Lachnospiraceae bacterium]
MKKFVIYKNPYKDKNGTITERVRTYLKEKGAEVSLFSDYRGEPGEDVMTIVLGGDGTMLQAIREPEFMNGPVIGINLGTLGFLTEIETGSIESALDRLLADDFTIENRLLLEGSSSGAGSVNALNDVVLSRSGSLRIFSFDIFVNGQPLGTYLADGMIVSTPTGSTGYNLSAGGPIANPASELIILTPICPHSLYSRSIILSSNDEVRIDIPASKEGDIQEMELSFDGAGKRIVKTGESITVKRSEAKIKFAKLGRDSFLQVLNKKMSEK